MFISDKICVCSIFFLLKFRKTEHAVIYCHLQFTIWYFTGHHKEAMASSP